MNIIFDVDGVLVDGWHADPARRKPWNLALKEDLGIDPERFDARFFTPGPRGELSRMERCLRGEQDLEEALGEVLPELGFRGEPRHFAEYWFRKDSNVNAEVLDVVRRLAAAPGVRLYIATGQEHRRAEYLWQQLEFRRWFDAIFYSAGIGHLKTEPEFFHAINRELSLAPGERPLFFDDQPHVVDLARAVGWEAVVVETAADVREHPWVQRLL